MCVLDTATVVSIVLAPSAHTFVDCHSTYNPIYEVRVKPNSFLCWCHMGQLPRWDSNYTSTPWIRSTHVDRMRTPKHDINNEFLDIRTTGRDGQVWSGWENTSQHLRWECSVQQIIQYDRGPSCNHNEADTRIFLHLAQAVAQNHRKAHVRTIDSDMVVLAVHFFSTLGLTGFWICFGSGQKICDILIHDLWSQLRPIKSLELPRLHVGVNRHHSSLNMPRKLLGPLGKTF